jgi:two-component system chemotaxis response regulator CheB
MLNTQRIIIAEDDFTNQLLVQKVLERVGYIVEVVSNGFEVIKALEREKYDAIITDWMMPELDGIDLIRHIRANYSNPPFILMMTALANDNAKLYALKSGADDFLAKPINIKELIEVVRKGIAKVSQNIPNINLTKLSSNQKNIPPVIAVGIVASTGGPQILPDIIKNLDFNLNATYFIIQHGPEWLLESLVNKLNVETKFKVSIARNEEIVEKGHIYFAPAKSHIIISSISYKILFYEGDMNNYNVPSADPLFKSIAESFGEFTIGVVLTGLGRDGTLGASKIYNAGGTIIIQDPKTATVQSMPNSILANNIPAIIGNINNLSSIINAKVSELNLNLQEVINENNY